MVSSYEKLLKDGNKNDALTAITAGMSKRQQLGQPVHLWKLANLPEAGNWRHRYQSVEQIMTTDLFTVLEEDLIEYVANIMNWRNIRHVLVENDVGKLVGLVSSTRSDFVSSETSSRFKIATWINKFVMSS